MAGYRPLQDPPRADLVRAQKLLGCFRAVLSVELDPVVSWGLGQASRGPSTPLCASPFSHPMQEGRLVEKDSSEWQLQGQPTVLLTLAHIFHRFAPLLVRGRRGREGGRGGLGGVPVLGAAVHEGQDVTRGRTRCFQLRALGEAFEGGQRVTRLRDPCVRNTEEIRGQSCPCVSLRPQKG